MTTKVRSVNASKGLPVNYCSGFRSPSNATNFDVDGMDFCLICGGVLHNLDLWFLILDGLSENKSGYFSILVIIIIVSQEFYVLCIRNTLCTKYLHFSKYSGGGYLCLFCQEFCVKTSELRLMQGIMDLNPQILLELIDR